MPACFDLYVWVDPPDRAAALSRFVDRYVDVDNPGDPRLGAFMRAFVLDDPIPGDRPVLAELRRGDGEGRAFSIYLHARTHHEAIITITQEDALVLGLGLDDPDNSPDTERQAATLLAALKAEFGAMAGIAGVELAPPQSAIEWAEDGLVLLRLGSL